MTDEQLQRLEEEREQLTGRMKKLTDFIGTEPFLQLGQADRELLTRQRQVMQEYYNILTRRLIRARIRKEPHNPLNTPLL